MLDANSRESWTYTLALNFILIERERIERFSIENTDALSKIRDSKISTVGKVGGGGEESRLPRNELISSLVRLQAASVNISFHNLPRQ